MEKNHPGHGGAGMGAGDGVPTGLPDELEYGPGGLAVLYAEENSRDALFAAMQRREAYATSGTRPVLRFFGGWAYPEDACSANDMVAQGYAGGVPMGGDLAAPGGENAAPRFIVSALADSGTEEYPGNPLQRIQLVKGWYEEGELRERVIDVAGGSNGADVDPLTCEQRGPGHRQLCTVWTDPAFNPSAPAFYSFFHITFEYSVTRKLLKLLPNLHALTHTHLGQSHIPGVGAQFSLLRINNGFLDDTDIPRVNDSLAPFRHAIGLGEEALAVQLPVHHLAHHRVL